MRPLSKELAGAFKRLLPAFAREGIETEEAIWKRACVEELRKAIEVEDFDGIEFWVTNLGYMAERYTLELADDAIEEILKLLFDFCVKSEYWMLVAAACRIYSEIWKLKHMDIKMRLPWRCLYALLQKLLFSRSNVVAQKPPPVLLPQLIPFMKACVHLFEDDAVEQMLELWRPLLDPQHHSFVMGHCLLSMFLPVHTGKHALWFNDFMKIWPMYRSFHWDTQWVVLFYRLSKYDFEDVDWVPHLPFLFGTVADYCHVPHTSMETRKAPVGHYQYDKYEAFFMDCNSVPSMLPYYARMFVNLMSNTRAKESVRWHIERLMFLLRPFCAPTSRSEDDAQSANTAVVFLSDLVDIYGKRARKERMDGRRRLSVLTDDDHVWFVEVMAPLVLMERFGDAPMIIIIKEFVKLAPDVLIPPLLDMVRCSFDFERLENAGIRTFTEILPVIVDNPDYTETVCEILTKYAEKVNFMVLQRSINVFTMFSLFGSCCTLPICVDDAFLVVTQKCIEIAEHTGMPEMLTVFHVSKHMFTLMYRHLSRSTIDSIVDMVANSLKRLDHQCAIYMVVVLDSYADRLRDVALQGLTLGDFAVLEGLLLCRNGFALKSLDEIEKCIDQGIASTEAKVSTKAVQAITSVLADLLDIWPIQSKEPGFVDFADVSIDWHCPNQEAIDAADRVCERYLATAKEYMASDDIMKRGSGVRILVSLFKGLCGVISNHMFDVIPGRGGFVRPEIVKFSVPQLKRHWESIYARIYDILVPDTAEKVLSIALSQLDVLVMPNDRMIDVCDIFTSLMDSARHTERTGDMVTHHFVYFCAIKQYSTRCMTAGVPFTEQILNMVNRVLNCTSHHSTKIRNKVAVFVQKVSAFFPWYVGRFIPRIVTEIEQKMDDRVTLAGLCSALCASCGLILSPEDFGVVGSSVLCVCRPLPQDVPDDAARVLRRVNILMLEMTDFYDRQFVGEYFVEVRKSIVLTAIERAAQYPGDREVGSYAMNLVTAVMKGRPNLILCDIFEFLVNGLASEGPIFRGSMSDCAMHAMPLMLELLIPRVPRKRRVEVSHVTPENFDEVKFIDRKSPGMSTTEPYFMTCEEAADPERQGVYFADGKERATIFRMLHSRFSKDELIGNMCKKLVNQEVHNEEIYCEDRVRFWGSLIRVFGPDMSILLLDEMEKLTDGAAPFASHMIAGEILSSVLFATKGWSYANISRLFPKLFPFLTRVLRDGEFEFQPIWYVSLVYGISDRDPRRFFWLFDHLISLFPESPTSQVRDVKVSSLLIDVVLEFAWRMPSLTQNVIDRGIRPLLQLSLESYEQGRECVVRAITLLFGASFRMDSKEVPVHITELFDEAQKKAGDQFVVSLVLHLFTVQVPNSFILNRLSIDKINDWMELCFAKNEDEEKRARGCLVHLARSNWLWSCGELPLTLESTHELTDRILKQMNSSNRVWQIKAMSMLLIESFVCSNFFFFVDDDITRIIHETALPALLHSNYDIQDSGGELLCFLLGASEKVREIVPDLVITFKRLLFSGKQEPIAVKLSGVKGLGAIIDSTVLFDTVPDYVYESFVALNEAQSMESALEPAIAQFFTDFWSMHNENLMPDVIESLRPFRESVRPSYFC